MELPTIVGICGEIGAGKDTVADYLVEAHGYRRLSWAEPLKEAAYLIYGPLGAERRHFWGTQADKAEPIPGIHDASGRQRCGRDILLHLGTEGARWLDPDTWVKWAMAVHVAAAYYLEDGDWHHQDVSDVPGPAARWVVSDVRFRNEVRAIHDAGGVLWEAVRVGGPPAKGATEARGHSSEEQWRREPKDAQLIARHGDLDGLRSQADIALAAGGREHAEVRDGF